MIFLATLAGCGKGEVPAVDFLLEPADLGAPVVEGSSYKAGAELGAALDAATPVFGAEEPAWTTVQEVWAILTSELVQDEGICPRPDTIGSTVLYEANCRSLDGYEWDGEVQTSEVESEEGLRRRFTADLTVTADVDDAQFSSITLQGSIERVTPSDPAITTHVDSNMRIAVDGYWEIHGPSEPELQTWAEWKLSGSVEGLEDGGWIMDFTADIGGSGAFPFASDALEDDGGCPVELRGEASLDGDAMAVFGGVESCDKCAVVDGVEACAP